MFYCKSWVVVPKGDFDLNQHLVDFRTTIFKTRKGAERLAYSMNQNFPQRTVEILELNATSCAEHALCLTLKAGRILRFSLPSTVVGTEKNVSLRDELCRCLSRAVLLLSEES